MYMHWVPTGHTVNKEYNVEVLREFRKRFRRKRPALFKSGQWHLHQGNAPVHNSILVTDYLTRKGIKTVSHPPYSPDLAPCDFCLFPKLKVKLRSCRYERIGEMKEAVTKVIDTLTQEELNDLEKRSTSRSIYKILCTQIFPRIFFIFGRIEIFLDFFVNEILTITKQILFVAKGLFVHKLSCLMAYQPSCVI